MRDAHRHCDHGKCASSACLYWPDCMIDTTCDDYIRREEGIYHPACAPEQIEEEEEET